MLNKLGKKRGCCAVVLFAILAVQLVMHLNVDNLLLDDWVFEAVRSSGESIFSFLVRRWHTWSSRLLIEGALTLITHSIWAFRILDSVMMVLLTWGLCRLAGCEERPGMLALSGAMVTSIPFAILRSTGWMATSLNYYWPLTCAVFALVPLADALWQRETGRGWQIAAVVFALYGANQEQTAAVIVGGCLVFGAVICFRNRRISAAIAAVFVVSVVQLVMHLLCPGNAVRADASAAIVNLRDYEQFSLIDKLSIGLTSTTALLLYWRCPMLLAAGAVILAAAAARRHGALTYIPMLLVMAVQGLAALLPKITADGAMLNAMRQYRTYELQLGPAHIGDPGQMAMMFISIMLLGLIALALYLSIGHRPLAASAVLVYAIGFAARMALSFSPTVVESGERTMMPLYGALMLCALLCIRDCRKENARRWPLFVAGIAVVCIAAVNFAGSFLLAA